MFEAEKLALQSTSPSEKRKIIGHLARIARLITATAGYIFDYNEAEYGMPSGLWPSGTPASHVFDAALYASTNAIFQCDFGYVIIGWGPRGWWRNVVLAMAHVAIAGPQDEVTTTPFALEGKPDDPFAFTWPAHKDHTLLLYAGAEDMAIETVGEPELDRFLNCNILTYAHKACKTSVYCDMVGQYPPPPPKDVKGCGKIKEEERKRFLNEAARANRNRATLSLASVRLVLSLLDFKEREVSSTAYIR